MTPPAGGHPLHHFVEAEARDLLTRALEGQPVTIFDLLRTRSERAARNIGMEVVKPASTSRDRTAWRTTGRAHAL